MAYQYDVDVRYNARASVTVTSDRPNLTEAEVDELVQMKYGEMLFEEFRESVLLMDESSVGVDLEDVWNIEEID